MKIFLSGIGLVGIALLISYFTNDWNIVDKWMLRVGGFGCIVALLLASGIARGSRMGTRNRDDKIQKRNFLKLCGFLISFSAPCLIVGLVIFYSTH